MKAKRCHPGAGVVDTGAELSLSTTSCTIQRHRAHDLLDTEIAECFTKLKDLVPTMPVDKKISKVQILQHVIDYILDLELTLENHPAVLNPPSFLHVLKERKPLTESSQVNTSTVYAQSVEPSEVLPRPVSC